MTETKKKKAPTVISPRGVFIFPKLAEPDTKFKKEGEYSVKLRLSAEAGTELIAKLSDQHAEAIAEGAEAFKKLDVKARKKLGKLTENDLFSKVYDKETEEETGEVEFRFTAKASGINAKNKPWTRGPITAFDAAGKPFKAVSKVWSGTEGKVAFVCFPYFVPASGAAGLSLKLEAVQVIELVGPGQRSSISYGFEEEDGFDAADVPDEVAPDFAAGDKKGGKDDAAADF